MNYFNKFYQNLRCNIFILLLSCLFSSQITTTRFLFSAENYRAPLLLHDLEIYNVSVIQATSKTLAGYGKLITNANEISIERGNFEIVSWPIVGTRQLDPHTGNEGGTTDGDFKVWWQGDYYYAKNLAISSISNTYLDGLGALPEIAQLNSSIFRNELFLWMSDYHPDGGQLFWPEEPVPFTVCLGLNIYGDNIKPEYMQGFNIPAGAGIYLNPGTWHNGVYIHPKYSPMKFLTRQGKVHARISVSWADEFGMLLRVPL